MTMQDNSAQNQEGHNNGRKKEKPATPAGDAGAVTEKGRAGGCFCNTMNRIPF